jgi:hypothetical protein
MIIIPKLNVGKKGLNDLSFSGLKNDNVIRKKRHEITIPK